MRAWNKATQNALAFPVATKIIKMAALVDLLSLYSLPLLFLSFPVTKQEENSTGYDSLATFYNQNFTDLENSSATAQPEFPTPTPSFSDATTEDPVTSPLPTPFLSPEPLPVSGLPSPLTDGRVSQLSTFYCNL